MDTDQLSRSLKDLEYRVKLLEKAQEPGRLVTWAELRSWMRPPPDMGKQRIQPLGEPYTALVNQFCDCGKDKLLCRSPDCPSHKPDPMGR